ncbi:MAG: galactose mutarotase [Lachnospiraceae bacterium]|nr:galactose mutarotase [Lachnospiraceae bacterium]
MMIKKFGLNKKGEAANLYIFENENGMEMHVSDFGATLHALMVPDKNGVKRDVVLGYDDPIGYEGPAGTFFGATVGRNANRIGNASFEYEGIRYQLDKNNGNNNLHSGLDFWSFRIWNVKETTENSITFSLHSPDGDQGFPGAVDVEVKYTLTGNSIVIDYFAKPDADTPINMTNHSYFNLSGHESGSVREQILWIDADGFTRTDKELIPTGEIIPVEGTPMDFRNRKKIGLEIDADYEALVLARGYDHNWTLKDDGEFKKVAELASEESGICMEVFTDLPGVQIYTANFVENEPGKHGVVYQQNQGVCFETQYYPDSVNHKNFKSCICKKDEEYRTRTEFKFNIC